MLDYVSIRWIMLDLLNRPSFLALRPLHMGKLNPLPRVEAKYQLVDRVSVVAR